MRALRHRTEAVSPVVGMVLMIGITVIIAGIVYLYSGGVAGDGAQERSPGITVTVDDASERINFVTMDGPHEWSEFRIIPDRHIRFAVNGDPGNAAGAYADVGAVIATPGQVQAGSFVQICGLNGPEAEVRIILRHIESNTVALSGATLKNVPACPTTWSDYDLDGIENSADTDDDNDGRPDAADTVCPMGERGNPGFNSLDPAQDHDGDGCMDATEDPDDDDDAVLDVNDDCPRDALGPHDANGQANNGDFDGDGCRNNEDDDDDNDKLADLDEVTYATDPFNPDSDGDGLDDDFEVRSWSSDPNDPDSDADGVGDGSAATPPDNVTVDGCPVGIIGNATNPDSDGDGCYNSEDGDVDGDNTDNCTEAAGGGDDDIDGDSVPNVADPDRDGDGQPNVVDASPDGLAADNHPTPAAAC